MNSKSPTPIADSAGSAPTVSVLLAVYNGAPYLPEALTSLRQQTWTDFECLLVDDASTDQTSAILAQTANEDHRFRVITLPENQGLAGALNVAIDAATGGYLARMDADDVAHPTRLETQVRFLDTHPEVGVCGTITGEADTLAGGADHIPHALIAWKLLFDNPLIHPSVMIRRAALGDVRYPRERRVAQDYHLWARLISITRFAGLTEPLIHYREHSTSLTAHAHAAQEDSALDARYRYWQECLETISPHPTLSREELLILNTDENDNNATSQARERLALTLLRGLPIFVNLAQTAAERFELRRRACAQVQRILSSIPIRDLSWKICWRLSLLLLRLGPRGWAEAWWRRRHRKET